MKCRARILSGRKPLKANVFHGLHFYSNPYHKTLGANILHSKSAWEWFSTSSIASSEWIQPWCCVELSWNEGFLRGLTCCMIEYKAGQSRWCCLDVTSYLPDGCSTFNIGPDRVLAVKDSMSAATKCNCPAQYASFKVHTLLVQIHDVVQHKESHRHSCMTIIKTMGSLRNSFFGWWAS